MAETKVKIIENPDMENETTPRIHIVGLSIGKAHGIVVQLTAPNKPIQTIVVGCPEMYAKAVDGLFSFIEQSLTESDLTEPKLLEKLDIDAEKTEPESFSLAREHLH